MKDIHVVLGAAHKLFVQNIEIFESDVILFVEEALSLYTGHVEEIELRDDILKFDALLIGISLFIQKVCDIVRDAQFRRGDEYKVDVIVARQCFDQRVHSPAEFEVAADPDREVVKPSLELSDRHHIQKRLGGMLVATVARIDDRNVGKAGRHIGCAFFIVTDGSDICEAGYNADRVSHTLAFGGGGLIGTGKTQSLSAQVHHGGFKTQSCPCAGLVEERRNLFAVAGVRVFIGVFLNVCSKIEELIEFLSGKIQWCEAVSHEDSFH